MVEADTRDEAWDKGIVLVKESVSNDSAESLLCGIEFDREVDDERSLREQEEYDTEAQEEE